VILYPSAVRTGMTGAAGMIDTGESVRGLLRRIDERRLKTTGHSCTRAAKCCLGEFRHRNRASPYRKPASVAVWQPPGP